MRLKVAFVRITGGKFTIPVSERAVSGPYESISCLLDFDLHM